MTPADPLRRRARATPDAPALEWGGGGWSYAELDAAADRIAAALRPLLPERSPEPAVRPPVVAAFLPPEPEAVAAIHGVPRAGAALAPLHSAWTAREAAAVLSRLSPAVLLGGSAQGGTAAEAGSAWEGREASTVRSGAASTEAPPALVHTVMPSSGTTGRPRLVALTSGNHLASAQSAIERLGLGPGDRWLASLGFAHIGGLAMAVRASVAGSTLVLRGQFDSGGWSDLLEEARVTHLSLVPTMLRRLLAARGERRAPSVLKAVLLGGAAADAGLLEEALARGWPLALTYGLTETASQVATAEPARVRRKPGTVGPPLGGTEVRLEDGEIFVRGPTVMVGYWDKPAESLEGGWLPTGDLGRLDAEGDLWIVGRRSARLVTGGVTVDPAEVEAVIAGHPGVRGVLVLGLPDEEWGERVVAAVEPDDRARPPAELFAELEALCREALAGPKRPKAFRLLDPIPRTPTGKPDRKGARRRLADEAG